MPHRHAAVRALVVATLALVAGPVLAYRADRPASRFDAKVRLDPGSGIGLVGETPDELPGFEAEKAGWAAFCAEHGDGWRVHVDRRSGAPLLVDGPGLRWYDDAAGPPAVADLEAAARAFLTGGAALFKIDPAQLVLVPQASGAIDRHHAELLFERRVDGIPVEGERVRFFLSHGNLVAFGADRWGRLAHAPRALLGVDDARRILHAYMEIDPLQAVVELEPGTTVLVPAAAAGTDRAAYRGAPGEGMRFHLAYRFVLEVAGEPGRWVGKVDAVTGEVLALYDAMRYAQARGGIYPRSSDGAGDDGLEQPDFPMPYADVAIGATPGTANDMGVFACTGAGATATTTLAGPYARIADACGAVSESTTCDSDIDLGTGPEGQTNCAVPPGGSPGDTHPARSAYYQVTRLNERVRHWLPGNSWLQGQVEIDTNVNATCNASWGGTLNMYRNGNGCANTAELAGVLTHEWGHGLDQNDGGGYDDPTEGYADVVALFATHLSCGGRGFDLSGGNCGGYGDTCLNCTGVRDDDWDQRQAHTPATPSGFAATYCGSGDGPCGKEQHCEGYIVGETMWDLAVRDLPAAGLDPTTSWQLAEKLFFKSRQGSGGNAYNCALPSSDGCNAGSWFNDLRAVDDDDGDLANGTPHAAAIFAAFARHDIACGAASDPSNQSTSTCPALASPAVVATPGANAVTLSWDPVPDAASYVVLRNDLGCGYPFNVVATVAAPATSWVDDGLPNGFGLHYAVQAQGANGACESAVSTCLDETALPHRGELILDRGRYACSDTIDIKLRDLDVDADSGVVETVAVTVSSTSETTPETVTLTETGPATAQFTGSIATSPGAVVSGDGVLQVADGDVVTVTYHDADDGTGSTAIVLADTAADCAGPAISNVRVASIADDSATVQWDTTEAASSRVDWGTTPVLGSVASDATLATAHAISLRPLAECGRIYFRVTSTDAEGNAASADVAGSPLAFNAGIIRGLYKDAFEASSGWTLEGEWQIQAPQGLGQTDPGAAFEGTQVLGQDLSGLGAHPGNYEPSTTQRAISPVIDASSLAGGELLFRRWLNVGGFTSAISSVEVKKNGQWNTVWTTSQFSGASDSSWSLRSIDISQYADGNAQMQIAFKQTGGSNGSFVRGGWNVDRLVVKSSSEPDFTSCGGCGAEPSFAGATAASDLDACADGGVEVRWEPAAAWGTGSGGTYSVYRDTDPAFAPSPSNRIATGVTGTAWTDAGAPNGVALYYVVRAENDETCSTGPANGGVEETNTVRVSARDDLSQPAPGDVGGTLLGADVNDAHVRLEWTAAPNAARYRVYRADAPAGPFALLAEVDGTVFEDVDEAADPAPRFYVVKAVDACGNEGP